MVCRHEWKVGDISTRKDGEESGPKFYLFFNGDPSKMCDLVHKRKQLNANVPLTLDSTTKMTGLFMMSHSQRVDYLLNWCTNPVTALTMIICRVQNQDPVMWLKKVTTVVQPWYPWGIGSGTLWMPKIHGYPSPLFKWHNICIEHKHILPFTLNYLSITNNTQYLYHNINAMQIVAILNHIENSGKKTVFMCSIQT